MKRKVYEVIDVFTCSYNLKALCHYFGVSRSGYYKWLSRKGTLNRYEQNRSDLKKLILEIHMRDVTMGYRAINEHIKEDHGWIVSNWLVHKVCRELGVVSKARKKWKYPKEEHHLFSNLVHSNWNTTRPFEIIVSDTTALYHKKHRKMHEATFYLDVFNNEIVGYAIGDYRYGQNKKVHIEALNSMLSTKKKRGYTKVETILHTDQGSVYSSKDYYLVHKNYNITRSMSRAGTPTDNPVIESFNSWFKPLLYQSFNAHEQKDFVVAFDNCVKYFNHERKAFKNAYKNPVQFRTELGFS